MMIQPTAVHVRPGSLFPTTARCRQALALSKEMVRMARKWVVGAKFRAVVLESPGLLCILPSMRLPPSLLAVDMRTGTLARAAQAVANPPVRRELVLADRVLVAAKNLALKGQRDPDVRPAPEAPGCRVALEGGRSQLVSQLARWHEIILL